MWVWHHIKNIATRFLVQRLVSGNATGHVVTKRDKIDGRFQRFSVGIGYLQRKTIVAEIAQHIARIRSARLDVAKELPAAILLQGFEHIFRLAA